MPSTKRVEVFCKYCNNPFHLQPSRVNVIKYCSTVCKKTDYQNRKVNINCLHCKKDFQAYKHELPRKKFCSNECLDNYRKVDQKRICELEGCNKEFICKPSSKQKFCSTNCRNESYKIRETKECLICGKEITRAKSLFKNNAVCSEICEIKHKKTRKGEKHPNWNPEKSPSRSYRGINWKEQRLKAIKRDNFACECCGTKKDLEVHHIIPYRRFNNDYLKANELSNLITVCHTCHLKIEPRIRKGELNEKEKNS